MSTFPKDKKQIKARINRYQNALQNEQKRFGDIDDGAGKRYLLGPLYLLAGDIEGALAHFKWFEKTFPDDVGEPMQYLCWTLALYRAGDFKAATAKLRQTMLMNLYLIPHLFGENPKRLDIWHGSNWEERGYSDAVPPEIFELWDENALAWAKGIYTSPEFTEIRTRYIDIHRQLKHEHPGPKRTALVMESFQLRNPNGFAHAMGDEHTKRRG